MVAQANPCEHPYMSYVRILRVCYYNTQSIRCNQQVKEKKTMAEQDGLVRVSAILPEKDVTELRQQAAKRGDNLTQGLKAAIATKLYLDDEMSDGGVVLIKRKDDSVVEVRVP
jgi:hypothetical protein